MGLLLNQFSRRLSVYMRVRYRLERFITGHLILEFANLVHDGQRLLNLGFEDTLGISTFLKLDREVVALLVQFIDYAGDNRRPPFQNSLVTEKLRSTQVSTRTGYTHENLQVHSCQLRSSLKKSHKPLFISRIVRRIR